MPSPSRSGAVLTWIAVACGLSSVLTYIVYAIDKTAARQNRSRVPERTLHLMALCGGWPGALLAQQRLRHKTQKLRFQLVFWLTGLFQLGALWVWLMHD
jgi:uncharacterized membrane protein YsdA (DUF1294 family)